MSSPLHPHTRARGINFRSNQVGGFFSQIGQLYMVHHVWHYKDLQSRKDVREVSWTKPGWDEIVAYTGMCVCLSVS